MTLKRAIKLLETEYEKAKKNEAIYNPIGYALYQVLKEANRDWRRKNGGND